MFLELRNLNNEKVVINTDKIICFRETQNGNTRFFIGNDNDYIEVIESLEYVMHCFSKLTIHQHTFTHFKR